MESRVSPLLRPYLSLLIVMPKRFASDEDEMKKIVVDTNENVVAIEDFLSDSVYLYERGKDEIRIVK